MQLVLCDVAAVKTVSPYIVQIIFWCFEISWNILRIQKLISCLEPTAFYLLPHFEIVCVFKIDYQGFNSQNCSIIFWLPVPVYKSSLMRIQNSNCTIWPTLFLLNVFTAFKGTDFYILICLKRYEPYHEKNLSSGFPTRIDTNRAVQLQKMARGLKFWI